MNLAKKDTHANCTSVLESAQKTPPPPTTTGVTDSVTKYHNSGNNPKFRRGQEVIITTQRRDREHFDGRIGTVAAVIYPYDQSRSIIYVRVGQASPCFYAYELQSVARDVEEVIA